VKITRCKLFINKVVESHHSKVSLAVFTNLIFALFFSSHSYSSVVGSLNGEVTVSSGATNYQLPIPLPPGAHEFSPSVSVAYSQQNGPGILGLGFSLSASSSISRCTPNVKQDGFFAGVEYSDLTRFCHDGKRLLAVDGDNGNVGTEYRVRSGNDNVNYQSVGGSNYEPEKWIVKSPDGRLLTFEQVDEVQSRYTPWQLVEQSDLFGNTVSYSYSQAPMSATEGEAPLLESIEYANHTVTFHYEDGNVFAEQYQEGRRIALTQRLQAIKIKTNGNLSYEYRFSYETIQTALPIDRLTNITKCFSDDSCLEPLQFGYQELPDAGNSIDGPNDQTLVIPKAQYLAAGATNSFEKAPSYVAGDVNKDGFADFCLYKVNAGVQCALYQDGGYLPLASWGENLGYSDDDDGYKQFNSLFLMDLNGDGFADYCIFDETGVRCALNDGGVKFSSASYWTTAMNQDDGVSFQNLNGDYYTDVCGFTNRDGNGTGQYQCIQGNGIDFSGTVMVDIPASTVDSWQKVDIVELISTGGANGSYLEIVDTENINYLQPLWLDMDGDFDRDLCWLSIGQQGFVCSYSSYHSVGDKASLQLSEPIKQFSLTLPSFIGHDIQSNVPGYQLKKEDADNVSKTVEEFGLTFRMVNLNGDELADICLIRDKKLQCRMNTGVGFSAESSWLDLSSIYQGRDDDAMLPILASMRTDDVNYDGLSDICLIENNQLSCSLNQGASQSFGAFNVTHNISSDIGSSTEGTKIFANFVRKLFNAPTRFYFQVMRAGYGNLINVSDVNNDGYPDFCYRSIDGIRCSTNANYDTAGLLTSVTNSFGLSTTIEYGNLLGDGLYDYATSVPAGFHESPPNIRVVSAIITDVPVVMDNAASDVDYVTSQIDYRYGHYVSNPDIAVQGFAQLSRSQAATNSKTVIDVYMGEHIQGREKRIESYINDVLVNTKENTFAVDQQSDDTYKVVLENQTETQFDLQGNQTKTATTVYSDMDEWGYPQSTELVESDNTDSRQVVTDIDYHHDMSNWILGRPALQTVTHTNSRGSIVRAVAYEYENGLMIKQTIEPQSANALMNKYEDFDQYGNPQTTRLVDLNGVERVSKNTYDELGRVLTSTNALDQLASFEYGHSYCLGNTVATDIAGKQIFTEYNEQCQKTKTYSDIDDNETTWDIDWFAGDQVFPAGHGFDFSNPIVYSTTETHASGPWKTAYFDALGREVISESVGLATTTSSGTIQRLVMQYSLYNEFNQKVTQSLPVYKLDWGVPNGSPTTPSWITLSYDDAGRVFQENKIGPDGNDSNTYFTFDAVNNSITTTLNDGDYSKTLTTGIEGKTIQVTEDGLVVNSTYDALGNLVETNREGVITGIDYDDRGFKSLMNDPATGIWLYQYNAFGELIQQTDAEKNVTTFDYDDLGRKWHVYVGADTTTFTYFEEGDGIGQPKEEVSASSAVRKWTYDTKGRPDTETLLVDTKVFQTLYEYDNYSRVIKTTQPNGLEIINAYDNMGNLSQVKIPASQIDDVDWDNLSNLYGELMQQLLELDGKIKDYQSLIYYHEMRALEYNSRVSFYKTAAVSVGGAISQLQALADQHRELANQYKNEANELLKQAAALKAEFGNLHFKYVGIENQQYKFEYRECTKYAKWYAGGRCKRYDIKLVTVPVGNINSMSDSLLAVYEQENIELFTPDIDTSYVIPYQLYEQAASAYQELATIHEEFAVEAEDGIHLNTANVYYDFKYRHYVEPVHVDGYHVDGYHVDGYHVDGYHVEKWVPIQVGDITIFIDAGDDVEGYDVPGYDVAGYDVAGYDIGVAGYVDTTQKVKPDYTRLTPYELNQGVTETYTLEDGSVVTIPYPCIGQSCSINNNVLLEYTRMYWCESTNPVQQGNTCHKNSGFELIQGFPSTTSSLNELASYDVKINSISIENNEVVVNAQFFGRIHNSNWFETTYKTYRTKIIGFKATNVYYYYTLSDGSTYTVSKNRILDGKDTHSCTSVQCDFEGSYKLYANESTTDYTNISNITVTKKQHFTHTLSRVYIDVTLVPVGAEPGTTPLRYSDLTAEEKTQFYQMRVETFGGFQTNNDIVAMTNEMDDIITLDGTQYRTITTRKEYWGYQALSREDEKAHYEELVEYYSNLHDQERVDSSTANTELLSIIDNYGTLTTQMAANEEVFEEYGFDGEDLASLVGYANEIKDTNANLTLWAVATRTPQGQVQNEVFGNGLYTQREYNAQNGLITRITTGAYGANSTVIRDLEYTYNPRGSVASKTDYSGDVSTTESFGYVGGLLVDWQFNQGDYALQHHYDFDSYGNLEFKTDAGSMDYDSITQQLVSRDHNGQHYTYDYDGNGNMLDDGDRTYQWTNFNKIAQVTMTSGGNSVAFDYDARNKRAVKRTESETRYYVSPGYEYVVRMKNGNPTGEEVAQHSFFNGYEVVATLQRVEGESASAEAANDPDTTVSNSDLIADKVVYIHRDLLGSGEVVTNAEMDVVKRRYYTPYGRDIFDEIKNAPMPEQTNDVVSLDASAQESYVADLLAEVESEGFLSVYGLEGSILMQDLKGFTSHEMLDNVGLVHMNARLFDPVIGRFVSPDSIVSDASTPLDYNRYMYVRGNPASASDPTGNTPLHAAVAVAFYVFSQFSDDPNVQIAGQLALMYATGGFDALPANPTWINAASQAGISATVVSFANTGDVGQALESGAFAAFSAGVTYSAAHGAINSELGLGVDLDPNLLAFHAVSHGAISMARGGTFREGAVSALIPKLVNGAFDMSTMNLTASTAIVAVSGGLASKAVGGDFLRGAVTAATVHLFNDFANRPDANLVRVRDHSRVISLLHSEGGRDSGLAEKTGTTYVPEDELFLMSHGNRNAILDNRDGGRIPLSVDEAVELIENSGLLLDGMTIRLMGCNTGAEHIARNGSVFTRSFARRLSAALPNNPVIAPSGYFYPHGNPSGWLSLPNIPQFAIFPPINTGAGKWREF